jgi:hypothetical protein
MTRQRLVIQFLEGKLVNADECDECDDVSRDVTYSAKHKSYLGKRPTIDISGRKRVRRAQRLAHPFGLRRRRL